VGTSAGLFSHLTALYLAPESTHYHSAELLERMDRVLDYLLRVQHPDGTIDLYITNFASPPDTSFVIDMLAPAAEVFAGSQGPYNAPGTREVGNVHPPRRRGIDYRRCPHPQSSMGGFGSPVSLQPLLSRSSLSRAHNQWLAEGLDLDSEGQFTEHSTGGYDEVSDNAFMTLGRMLNRPDLLSLVRRNLETLLYFLHPNDEIATDISQRQDRFMAVSILRYYHIYRFMAYYDQNGRFASVANYIERNHLDKMVDI